MFETSIGIDLGTSNILVYVKNEGLIINEPTVVAVNKASGKIIAFGNEAKLMIGREPQNIMIIKPLTLGVISDFSMTEQLLRHYILMVKNNNKIKAKFFRRLKVSISIPSGVSEVERRAVQDTAYEAGARKIQIIEEPIAAAIGAGIDISEAYGRMVVDIGGGTTDVAVISLGGIVIGESLKVAGDAYDQVIINYIRRVYNVVIGEHSAQKIKKSVASVIKRDENKEIKITGRDLVSGLPKALIITSDETIEPLTEVTNRIIDTVYSILEKTPPELAADIFLEGILLTGGGSLVYGINHLMEKRLGVGVIMSSEPLSSVALGLASCLEN